jgi:hypothetical protein
MIHGLFEPLALSDFKSGECASLLNRRRSKRRSTIVGTVGLSVPRRPAARLIDVSPLLSDLRLRFKKQGTFVPQAVNLSILTGIGLVASVSIAGHGLQPAS